jgi:hypothetical protein
LVLFEDFPVVVLIRVARADVINVVAAKSEQFFCQKEFAGDGFTLLRGL